MTAVFISYARHDRSLVRELASDLRAASVSVWWDYELYAGDNFHDAILAALDAAHAVVVVWSDTSVRSLWVRDEATRALRQGKLVATHLPSFNLENLPLGFGQIHSTDVYDREGTLRALRRFGIPRQQPTSPPALRRAVSPEERVLGTDPETGKTVILSSGHFAPYVHLANRVPGEKSRRTYLPRERDPRTVDLSSALQLLALPRTIGAHPETGKAITAGIGRYGRFIHYDGRYVNLESDDQVFSIGLNRAVALLSKNLAPLNGAMRRRAPVLLRELGNHPQQRGPVLLLSGRYGPYVKHGDSNAKVPRTLEPGDLTLDQAISLLTDREQSGAPRQRSRDFD
jgi:hypothetical protein